MWKIVPNFSNYEVSGVGEVRRATTTAAGNFKKGRKLSVFVSRKGYLYVRMVDDAGKSRLREVHTLVMKAFVGPRPSDMEVNHKDGNKVNNCLSNLEYITHAQNLKHAYKLGLRKPMRGSNSPVAKLTEEQVLRVIELNKTHSQPDIVRELGINKWAVCDILRGKSWGHLTGIKYGKH